MELKTERLILRPLHRSDADWVTREISNPKVHQWLTAPPRPYGREDAVSFIDRTRDDPYCRAICLGDTPCGVISILRQPDALPDLGYWLAEPFWGQGVMTEAARALVGLWFAHSSGDLRSGWITGNVASRNVLGKLGFEPDGAIRARSEFHDREVTVEKVRLTRSRWQALSATP